MTVTEFPQLAHTESSSASSVRTGSEPRLTHLEEVGSHRSSGEKGREMETLKNTSCQHSYIVALTEAIKFSSHLHQTH